MPWGGKREGAGRHEQLKASNREKIAHNFYGIMRWAERGTPESPRTEETTLGGRIISYREISQPWKPPFRDKIVSLTAKHYRGRISERMIRRCIEEFNPAIRGREEIWLQISADPHYHPADLEWERIKYTAAWWPHTNTEILQIVAREFSDPEFVRVNSETRGGMSFDEMLWRRTRVLAGYR
jgi:hypothetical protein